jgi:coenzyme F420-reducing hydrogenase beta subunit
MDYGARLYVEFYKAHQEIYNFKKIQPTLFLIHQGTFQAFLLWAQVVYRFAYNTIMNACNQELCLWLIKHGPQYGDPQKEYGKVISSTMITLLRAFGNFEKVTDALLTSHYMDLLKKTNLKDKKKCRILAIIAFICMTTFRPTTIEYMVIGNLTFKFEQIQSKLLQFQQDVEQQDRSKKKLS